MAPVTPRKIYRADPKTPSQTRSNTPSKRGLQLKLSEDVCRILESSQHPATKIQQLANLGLIQVAKEKNSETRRVKWSISYDRVRAFTTSATEKNLKTAALVAAQEACDRLQREITSHGIHYIYPKPLPPTRGSLPSANEMRQMSQDQSHLATLREIQTSIAIGTQAVGVLSIDIECFEDDHDEILEVGISYSRTCDLHDSTKRRTEHIIISDKTHLHNLKFVPDHRDNFLFGHSRLVDSSDMLGEINDLTAAMCAGVDEVFFVGHTTDSDLRWLHKAGITSMQNLRACDIARVYRAWRNPTSFVSMTGMTKILEDIGVDAPFLHNGGNDAHYNLDVLQHLTVHVE